MYEWWSFITEENFSLQLWINIRWESPRLFTFKTGSCYLFSSTTIPRLDISTFMFRYVVCVLLRIECWLSLWKYLMQHQQSEIPFFIISKLERVEFHWWMLCCGASKWWKYFYIMNGYGWYHYVYLRELRSSKLDLIVFFSFGHLLNFVYSRHEPI